MANGRFEGRDREEIPLDRLRGSLNRAQARFSRAVRPLFRLPPRKAPELIGCGVFLSVGTHRFILSAAHVLDHFDGPDLYIAADEKFVGVEGVANRSEPHTGTRRDDDVTDAAVFLIKSGSLVELEASFLNVDDLGVDANPIVGRQYLVMGYPTSRAKLKRGERVIYPELFSFVTGESAGKVYGQLAVKQFSHLAVTLDRNNITDGLNRMTAPRPNGLSGCGVWRFDSIWKAEWEDRDKLVAILTEYHGGDVKALLSTRVAIHLALIRHAYPELISYLPVSRTTEVRLRPKAQNPDLK